MTNTSDMTGTSDNKRAFFISFNQTDRSWATWIAWVLEEAGYSVYFQDWDFRGNFVEHMNRSHAKAYRTLAVLSDNYFGSDFTLAEWSARFAQDPAAREDRLVPAKVGPLTNETILDPIVHADLTSCEEDEAQHRLLARVQQAVDSSRVKPDTRPDFPGRPGAPPRQVPQKPQFPVVSPPPATDRPYPGLDPFTPEQSRFFFGRKGETDLLVGRLRNADCRFFAVVGASGVGKSSLIYAGLIPRLRTGSDIKGSETWHVKPFKPGALGDNPFLALATYGLEPLLPRDKGGATVLTEILKNSTGIIRAELADQILAEAPQSTKLVFFIDQFEELFTQTKEAYCEGFIDLLAETVCHPRVRVLATLRGDYLSHALRYPKLALLLQNEPGIFPLGRPGDNALREMIRCPAERAHLKVDDNLVEAIVHDAGDDLGALPLVAFCLNKLWQSVDRSVPQSRMTLAAYNRIGRLQESIGKYAHTLLKDLQKKGGADFNNKLGVIFAELISVEAGKAIRRRAYRDKFPRDDQLDQLVQKLIQGRLLCTECGKDDRVTVELAQDALLGRWPELKDWIDNNRADMLLWGQLAAAADRWLNAPRPGRDVYLWWGHRLKAARELANRWPYDPTKIETTKILAFIKASRKRKWKRIAINIIMALTFSCLFIVGVIFYVKNFAPFIVTRRAMPVGSFDKNPFGLYDMLGNVWEWTNDCVSSSPDPPDTSHRTANLAFCRASGGAWDNHEEWKVRWDSWALFEKDLRVPTIGFRVARELDDSEKQHPFRDCLTCPEMEIIPAGVVQVRSPPSRAEETCEQDRPTGSVPVISVGRLALGKYEVTINEWNACGVECSGDRSTDYEQSDGHRPIANVSWEDAKRYVNWLSTTTHRRYRLPTLDEWQHAAKDSTESCRYWGNEIGRGNANCGACGLTWHQLLDAVGLPLWWLDGP